MDRLAGVKLAKQFSDLVPDLIKASGDGDLRQRVVAVFQVKHDTAHPADDLVHQYH